MLSVSGHLDYEYANYYIIRTDYIKSSKNKWNERNATEVQGENVTYEVDNKLFS